MQRNKQNEINKSTAINFVDEDSGLVVTTRVDVFNDTIWLTQNEIARLFQCERSNVTRHINNIISDGELDENGICAFFTHMGANGERYRTKYYNLDMILSVGYRVNSRMGIKFRRWANGILKRYTLNGFAINPRLKCKNYHI